MLEGLEKFDPNLLLQSLYDLERQLKLLWEGKVCDLVATRGETSQPKRYGVENADDEEEGDFNDSEDYSYGDEYDY